MKLTLLRVLMPVLALLLLCACAPTTDTSPSDEYLTFTDDSGATVTLPARPSRVAVLFSSLADLWLLAGGEVAVTVGETVERGLAPEGVLLVDAGAGKSINTELLLSYEPDFVIGSLDVAAHGECAALLRDVGVATALFRVESFDDYLRVLGVMTDITGNTQALAQYGTARKTDIDALLAVERTETPRVLFLRAGSSARSTKAKSSDQHFAAAMIVELGGINLADEAPVLIDTLSIEAILVADPDVIFVTTMGDESAARSYMDTLLCEPTWQSLTAVRSGRVHYLPRELFQFKPNAAWYEAYHMLAELMYETKE